MGGWATDMLSRRGVGTSWSTQQLAARQQQPEQPPEVGVTLEGLDAEAAARGEKIPKDPREDQPWTRPGLASLLGMRQNAVPWDERLGQVAPGALDALRGAATGIQTGLGQAVDTPETRQSAQRSPWLYGGAKLAGEIGGQAAVIPQQAIGGVASGMLGGLLSGYGNSEGTMLERGQRAVEGAALGAGAGVLGEWAGAGMSKLGGLLKRKGPEYGYEQATRGLMARGAEPSDLSRLDKTGGRVQYYDDLKRMDLPGTPRSAQFAAQRAVDEAEATRAAIEARNAAVQVDPAAVESAVRGANPYPGVPRFERAADKAATQVAAAAPNPAALDVQRGYFGDATNFASHSPNAKLGKAVHGAINTELEDAYNLAEPGAGSQWRQAGLDERSAIALRDVAKRGADVKAAAPWTPGEVATGGLSRLLNNNRHGIAEAGYGAAASVANTIGPAAEAASKLPNAGGPLGAALAPATPRPDQAAIDLLHSPSRGAELGKYQMRFAEAYGAPGGNAVQQLITELSMTDPEFRMTILPMLAGRGGMR